MGAVGLVHLGVELGIDGVQLLVDRLQLLLGGLQLLVGRLQLLVDRDAAPRWRISAPRRAVSYSSIGRLQPLARVAQFALQMVVAAASACPAGGAASPCLRGGSRGPRSENSTRNSGSPSWPSGSTVRLIGWTRSSSSTATARAPPSGASRWPRARRRAGRAAARCAPWRAAAGSARPVARLEVFAGARREVQDVAFAIHHHVGGREAFEHAALDGAAQIGGLRRWRRVARRRRACRRGRAWRRQRTGTAAA